MGELVNLRLARKHRARAAAELKAESNRRAHGRTKTEWVQTAAERSLADRRLDGHRRDETE